MLPNLQLHVVCLGDLCQGLPQELGALGQAIEQLRREAGLSQEELADCAGIHSTQISAMERGMRNPTFQTLARIASSLGTTVGGLTTLGDQIQRKEGV